MSPIDAARPPSRRYHSMGCSAFSAILGHSRLIQTIALLLVTCTSSDGLQPSSFLLLVIMASNLLAMDGLQPSSFLLLVAMEIQVFDVFPG